MGRQDRRSYLNLQFYKLPLSMHVHTYSYQLLLSERVYTRDNAPPRSLRLPNEKPSARCELL